MFWGLIMEPNKRYTQVVEKPFHISQAAMDISTGDTDPCQVMVVVDGKNFLVCTLQKNKTIQVPIDLYFKAGDSISFLTNGKCNVHLTGYLDPEFEEDLSGEEEEDDEEEEAPALIPAKNKRKLENGNDSSASKKAKQEKKSPKKPQPGDEDSSDDSDDDEDQLQKLLDAEDVDTDENDDSFKVNTSAEVDDSDDDDDDEDDDEDGEEEAEEEESSDEAETSQDTSLDTSKNASQEIDTSKLTKSQLKRLKAKQRKQAKLAEQPQTNGVEKTKKDKPDAQQKADKKKEKKAADVQAAGEKKEKKALSGGVQIEDLKVGNGPVAKPGKVVMVYYEGRLKQNNKMFDSCNKGPGFKFRLGSKEVINGWDVGVAGMKVGGKRRIVCPPAMAYGAKGSPPVIPPNSTLSFEVELKNVK